MSISSSAPTVSSNTRSVSVPLQFNTTSHNPPPNRQTHFLGIGKRASREAANWRVRRDGPLAILSKRLLAVVAVVTRATQIVFIILLFFGTRHACTETRGDTGIAIEVQIRTRMREHAMTPLMDPVPKTKDSPGLSEAMI